MSDRSLIAQDLPSVVGDTSLLSLYQVRSDFELWFSTPDTVQEFPAVFLECAQDWRARPELFVDLRRFASDVEVERMRGVAIEAAASTARCA